MNRARALKRAKTALARLAEFKPRRFSDPFDRRRVFRPQKGKGSFRRLSKSEWFSEC